MATAVGSSTVEFLFRIAGAERQYQRQRAGGRRARGRNRKSFAAKLLQLRCWLLPG